MHALKAHVKNGRLLLDEPTHLPDGSEVELIAIDDDGFEPEERARLLRAIDEGIDDVERGDSVDAIEFAERLRKKHEDRSR